MNYHIPEFEQERGKLYINEPTFYSMALDIGSRVIDHQNQSGQFVDTVVGAPRGALNLMSIVAQMLHMNGQQVQCINVNTRSDDGERSEVKTGQLPETSKVEDKVCLWLDDVRDSGLTEDAAQNILYSIGARAVLRGAIAWKPESDEAEPPREPDFYTVTTNKWIVFPWERLAEYVHAQQALRLVVPADEIEGALQQLKSNFMRAQGFSSVPYFRNKVTAL